ncbi:hypothetical protein LCGC14_0833140 [marine sediment metagenome]|uniref:Uncharacterized protein n=1 Tax=marine sediment metagenome TaxID=412755 RepID=A0A0F9PJZ4_9ZZZZ
MTWRLKHCSRCGGDTFVESDIDGCWYEHCLMCGYTRDLPAPGAHKEVQSCHKVLAFSKGTSSV